MSVQRETLLWSTEMSRGRGRGRGRADETVSHYAL